MGSFVYYVEDNCDNCVHSSVCRMVYRIEEISKDKDMLPYNPYYGGKSILSNFKNNANRCRQYRPSYVEAILEEESHSQLIESMALDAYLSSLGGWGSRCNTFGKHIEVKLKDGRKLVWADIEYKIEIKRKVK